MQSNRPTEKLPFFPSLLPFVNHKFKKKSVVLTAFKLDVDMWTQIFFLTIALEATKESQLTPAISVSDGGLLGWQLTSLRLAYLPPWEILPSTIHHQCEWHYPIGLSKLLSGWYCCHSRDNFFHTQHQDEWRQVTWAKSTNPQACKTACRCWETAFIVWRQRETLCLFCIVY